MQIFPFTQKEINFFKELNKHKIPYIIIGLASAAMQGAPIVTKDVDIWFENLQDAKLQDIIKRCGAIYIPSIELNPPALAGNGFELLDLVIHVHGLKAFRDEYKKCHKIKIAGTTLTILPLERIIRSKQALNRKKDKLIIPVLKDALIAKKEKERDYIK